MTNQRRRQPQHKLLCSQDTVQSVNDAHPTFVSQTVVPLGKTPTKLQLVDALIRVALRHPEEVSADLIANLSTPEEFNDD